ncbi:hypothetical protein [Methylacidimicrobium sp. B4]|uniref:hypothetical protein n=1 Tax=Methylacidimicrobium sp. B4 TaxID=2796139 RepID=UPI001A8FEDDB|nr:hypothetical protein [Methylacidimicrobium sp. B4]QSR85033.1 hypothetical protein MacB4_01825 [Methylacidimicrobium sp. B4]
MNNRLAALLGVTLLWISTASGFAEVSSRPQRGDPLDRGIENLTLHAEEAGRWLSRGARKWNRAITPACLALAIGIAAWRVLHGRSNGGTASQITLYLLLSLLLAFRAPEIFFHPSKGLLPKAARYTALHLARLSPERAQGTNLRQWWRGWIGNLDDPSACKLSPVYAQERVLGFPEGGSQARRFLVNQARHALIAMTKQDPLPGRKLDNAIHALLLLAERKLLRFLLVLCLVLLGVSFFLFSLLHLLCWGGSTFLWELIMATALMALPLILVTSPPRCGRFWLRLFLAASLLPIAWHLLAATSYLGLTTLFASVLGERGLLGELRETGGELLKGMISKRSLLFSFWSLTPELPRTILLGLYELMAGLISFCSVAVAVCSTVFLGAVLPLVGVGWLLRRTGAMADSLIAGWGELRREIALAATALESFLAAQLARLNAEEPAIAILKGLSDGEVASSHASSGMDPHAARLQKREVPGRAAS